MIKGNSNLHVSILSKRITMSQKHNLIMMCHIIIGQRNTSGTMYDINQPIVTIGQRTMVNPNISPTQYRHSIAVRFTPPPIMPWGVPYVTIPPSLAIVYVYPMYDYVCRVVDLYAWPTCHVYARPTSVDCFVRVHHQFFFQLDYHVPFEDYP